MPFFRKEIALTRFTTFLTTTALFSAVATSAGADVTSSDVWEALKSQLGLYGEISANQNQIDDTLVISDIVLTQNANGVLSTTSLSGAIGFREIGDGRVEINYPEQMQAKVTSAMPDAPAVGLVLDFSQRGMTTIASGTADNIRHDFNAPSMTYNMSGLQVGDDEMDGAVTINMTDIAGFWTNSGTEDRRLEAEYGMAAMAIGANFTDPAQGGSMVFNLTMSDLDLTTDNTVPASFDPNKPEELFTSGFAVDADITYGATSYTAQVVAEGQTTNLEGSIGNGTFNVGMDQGGIRYATSANDVTAGGGIVGLPIPPVEVNFSSSSFELAMPLAKSDTAQDFKFVSTLKEMTVSDFLWAMVDPAQQLPRSPATIVMDLSGKANWLVDIMNPEVAENLGGTIPGKIESLSLNDLQVTIAGAELTGDGAFTFDNNDLQTFGGMPRPQGAIELALSGGITLLDKLTAMQLVPQEQAMGIKMMSGLFTKPGTGPDTLTTKIEIDANGGVFANGQQLQ